MRIVTPTVLLVLLSAVLAAEEPIPFVVSKIGKGSYSKSKFDELWLAFRTEYHVKETDSSLHSHDFTDEAVSRYFHEAQGEQKVFATQGRPEFKRHFLGANSTPPARPNNPARCFAELARLKVVKSDPGKQFVTVTIVPPSSDSPLSGIGGAVATGNFKADEIRGPTQRKFYPLDTGKSYSGVLDCYVTRDSEGDLHELGPMADTPELQKKFIDELKAGKCFMVILPSAQICPDCRGSMRALDDNKKPCMYCKASGRIDAVYMLKWDE